MFAEDLSVFFDVDGGFAVAAQRTPAAGGTSPDAAVIFDVNGLNSVDFDVVTEGPSFIVPASSWPTLVVGDAITIGGVAYKVRQADRVHDGALAVAILVKA
jgi:hypothetical protein